MTADELTFEGLVAEAIGHTDFAEAVVPPNQSRRMRKPLYRGGDALTPEQMPQDRERPDLAKPWMKFHRLELVLSADQVRELVDRALRVGRVALDTETQGLDTRIEYREDGSLYTRHAIIGYCIGIEGDGYYVPVRHDSNNKYDGQYNVDSVERTEAEIKRLCVAAQPVLKAGVRDVLGAKESDFEVPPRVVIEFWHAKFDQEMLYPVTGIDIWSPYSFEDGMLMAYTLDSEGDQGLKENARARLAPVADPETGANHAYEMIKYEHLFAPETPKSERKLQRLVPRAEGDGKNVVLYGCSDAICTNLLCRTLLPEVQKKTYFRNFYLLEKQVAQVVRIIERTRVLINKSEIAVLLQEAEEELLTCENEIKKVAKALGFGDDFNPKSSSQLAELLFGPNGVWKGEKPGLTKEGQFKTDEKTIEGYAQERNAPEVFTLVLKHRRIAKVRGTYLQNLAKNTDELDQLRLNFKPTGAATGRFSAPKGEPSQGYAGIPIQGIPARDDPKKPKVAHSLRKMFIARPGYTIVKVDYASQELRIVASMSGESKWIAEYEKERETGEAADLHFLTAQAFYPGLTKESPDLAIKRGAGKTANFALVYGGGVNAVQRATGCDKVEGARLKAAFDASVPSFSKWVSRQKEYVKDKGGVFTGFGRFISIADANLSREEVLVRMRAAHAKKAKKGKKALTDEQIAALTFLEDDIRKEIGKCRGNAERQAINYPIQGSGADILKISLVLLAREFSLRGWLRSGGDDSVRIIMTVHDEVVFEVRDERIAEALPVIIRIMEYPSQLIGWRVPLVAEAEIGPSWAAKLKWSKMLKGEVARPPYLEGVQIEKRPALLILGEGPAGSRPVSPVPPLAEPAPPSTTTAMSEPPTPAVTPSIAPAVSEPANVTPVVNGSPPARNGAASPRKVASFRLKRLYLDKKLAMAVAKAMAAAKIEGLIRDQPEREMVVEFVTEFEGQRVLLYSAEEGYRVHVDELEFNLRHRDLLESWEEREALVA